MFYATHDRRRYKNNPGCTKRFELGADKITINQEALNDPGFIKN